MKLRKLLLGLFLAVPAAAGVATFAKPIKKAEVADAASVSKTRVVLELQDQCYSTSDARDPIVHLWSITYDSSMGYDASGDSKAAGVVNDLEGGGANVKQVNDDGSIDTGMTWVKQEGSYRYWKVQLPWYITGFTFKLHCGSYWGGTEQTVTKHGSHMIYNYGSWDNWNTSLAQDTSSLSNTYSVTNYTITAASSGGVSGDGHTAQVKGNGGSYTTSGNYFPRQKILLKATAGTYSAFDHWSAGNSTTSATTYDYVGTAAKTYTATFSDTRSKFTVVFKNYDGTTLETQSNVYQGSSVVYGGATPTKPDDGSKVYTFSHWEDSNGVDKTSALANLQSDLTVYAAYSLSYKAGFYIYGDFGVSPTWSVETAFLMTEFSEASYAYSVKATVEIPYGSVFKLRYYNTAWYDDQEFDTRNVQNDSPALYCYDCSRNDHAFQCYAGGRYTIILHNFENQGKTIYINFENSSRNAEQLAAYVMKFGANPESGHCQENDRFPAARSMYLNNLSSSEKSKFQGFSNSSTSQFKNGYDRYVAWARALGQNPWAEGAANNIRLFALVDQQTSSSILIITLVSLVSVSAIGGYFFIRRKKAR